MKKVTETEIDDRRVVGPWTQDAPPPEGGRIFNIGRPLRCRNPFGQERQEGMPPLPPETLFYLLVILISI